MKSILSPNQFVDVLSDVTGPLLGVFWLVWEGGWGGQNVTIFTFMVQQPMDWLGVEPILT